MILRNRLDNICLSGELSWWKEATEAELVTCRGLLDNDYFLDFRLRPPVPVHAEMSGPVLGKICQFNDVCYSKQPPLILFLAGLVRPEQHWHGQGTSRMNNIPNLCARRATTDKSVVYEEETAGTLIPE